MGVNPYGRPGGVASAVDPLEEVRDASEATLSGGVLVPDGDRHRQ